jgi:L-malate glycosyltransferase
LVALEAMSCGVPVIATSSGGTGELIRHGVSGFLCDPEDIEGMVRAGLGVLTDPDLWTRVAGEARRSVLERFSEERILDRYEALYRGLLAEQTRAS